jgi:hypothetical protein
MQENLTITQLETLGNLMSRLSKLNYQQNNIGVNSSNYDLELYVDSIDNLYATFFNSSDAGEGVTIEKLYVKISPNGRETLLNREMTIFDMERLLDTLTKLEI